MDYIMFSFHTISIIIITYNNRYWYTIYEHYLKFLNISLPDSKTGSTYNKTGKPFW